ncbi:MAG: hypothetical protein PHF67_00100 [Candidatus Nanoarchaeia archaeon]|nr:hypothetical protein [Candidatus Nanoarchaeia archaeon]
MKKRIESVIIRYGGKARTVQRQLDNGTVEEVCLIWYSTDFARGCISQVPVEMLEEVVRNNGYYAEGNLKKYANQGLLGQKCIYCYATTVEGNTRPKVVNKKTRKSFADNGYPAIIRIGVSTDPGHPYYYGTLMDFLGLCKEFSSRVIITTKMLPFGIEGAKETARFARDNNPAVGNLAEQMKIPSGKDLAENVQPVIGLLSYSIGYNHAEPGAVSQGFSNQWRINQAERFYKKGINTCLTVTCDVAQSIESNLEHGSALDQALNSRKKTGIPIRILPLRAYKPDAADRLYAMGWYAIQRASQGCRVMDHFQSPGALCEDGTERLLYQKYGAHYIPKYLHPDFQRLMEQGIGFCGGIGKTEYCDKCTIEDARITFPRDELVKLEGVKVRAYGSGKKFGKGQMKLF